MVFADWSLYWAVFMRAAGHADLAGLVDTIVDCWRFWEIAITSKAFSWDVDRFSKNVVESVRGLSSCWDVLAGRNTSWWCWWCLTMSRGVGLPSASKVVNVGKVLHAGNAHPLFRLILQRFLKNLSHVSIILRDISSYERGVILDVFEVFADLSALVKGPSLQHLEEYHAKWPTITLLTVKSSQIGLWSHVWRRANIERSHYFLGHDHLAEPKIDNFRFQQRRYDDVGWLQVPMNDAILRDCLSSC